MSYWTSAPSPSARYKWPAPASEGMPTDYAQPPTEARGISPITISFMLSLKFAVDCYALILGTWHMISEAISLREGTQDGSNPTEAASGGV